MRQILNQISNVSDFQWKLLQIARFRIEKLLENMFWIENFTCQFLEQKENKRSVIEWGFFATGQNLNLSSFEKKDVSKKNIQIDSLYHNFVRDNKFLAFLCIKYTVPLFFKKNLF